MSTASSILHDDTPLDSIPASELETLFTSGRALSSAVTQVCEVRKPADGEDAATAIAAFEERSSKIRERFISLAKRYWDTLPSSSTGGTITESLNGNEAAENLVDIIWTVDQAFENGQSIANNAAAVNAAGQQPNEVKPVHKLGLLVKELNSNGILSTELLKQRLDIPLLQLSGIFTAQASTIWTRTEARTKTSLLYKQQKYNLLREESEGYSKLEVELLSSMGSPHSSRTAQPAEPISAVRRRAETTLENIKGLIGYFDLDPARALDVILDVFADNVLYHHVFFRELLLLSPWAPKVRHDPLATDPSQGLLPDGGFEPIQEGANTICAQILGFKFAWYTTPEGSAETPSEKLYLMAAILIWEGLVDLPSLWPHLPPQSDDDFSKLKDKYRDEISDRIANARSNALAMAGMLLDDTEPPPPKATPSLTIAGSASGASAAVPSPAAPIVPSDPPNARLGLLRALLSIGAFKPAYWILSNYSWICEPVPEIADLVLRLLNYSIAPYYNSFVSPFAGKKESFEDKRASLCRPRQRYSVTDKKIVPPPSTAYAITGKPLDHPRSQAGHWREQVYFFAEWQDRLPRCNTAEEVLEVVGPLLKIVGVHANRNREFFVHLLRIAKQETSPSATQRPAWEGILRMHLIPALAISEPNPSTTHELWEILRNFPYTARFAIYGEWKDRLYKRMPELRVKKVETDKEAKSMLKRLSADNVKQFGRSLAKIAHTNPCPLFEIALNQVQSYDNLIAPVVDSFRYLTPFGYDVLAYSLLDALSNPEKERTKSDGTNISLWLQSLAIFAGTLCKRWNMEVAYILQYILNQLREGNSKDLVVLRELISKMSGIEPVSDLSDSQVVALGGGPTLQSEALHPTTLEERKNQTKRSALRLKTSLLDGQLVGPLLVAVAKARQECVLGLDDAPLKYLGNLFDQCQQVLFQYHDFLLTHLRAEAYGKALPSLRDLWESYGVEPGIAFHVTRPALQLSIQAYDKARMERLREEAKASQAAKAEAIKAESAEVNDVTMTGTAPENEEIKPEGANDGTVAPEENSVQTKETHASSTSTAATNKTPWHPVLNDAIALAVKNMPENVQPYMSPGFFVTFWQLSLYDILVPMERYQNEVDRLKGIVRELDAVIRAAVPSFPGQLVDKAAEAEAKRAQDRCMQTIQALNSELKLHTVAYEATRKRLLAEKNQWFMPDLSHLSQKEATIARRLAVQHFVQDCLLPRARLSPIDATYCARIIRVMHNVGASNFPSLHVYDRIFSDDLSPIVFSCTEGEARNYGRFLHDCLSDLTTWYRDESLYTKQAIGNGLPGFLRVWVVRAPGEPISESTMLQYSQFKTITAKWHKKLCEAFVACLESRDYMCIRNSILILTKIAKFFPLFTANGNKMEEVVATFLSSEKREDLRVLGIGYSALLKKQSSSWISANAAAQASSTATTSQRNTSTSDATASPAHATPAISQASTNSLTPAIQAPTSQSSPARSNASRLAPEDDRDRRRPENSRDTEALSGSRPSVSRQASEIANASPNGARTLHALPARPSLEGDRRDSSQPSRQLRGNASPANSRTSTPVVARGVDDMQVDEPRRASARHEDRFAKPAVPQELKVSSRPSSPRRREPESPRRSVKDPQDSPREDRRSNREESEKVSRRSRAGSEESSHSSQRDKKDRSRSERDRSDRREREHRSDRSDRERERRSDRDRERDKESDRHRRDRDRPREREKDTSRDKDSSSRDKESRDRDAKESSRDKDRERRHREPSGRSSDDKRDKERPRERESRRRESDMRADDTTSEPTGNDKTASRPSNGKEVNGNNVSKKEDSKSNEPKERVEATPPRDLKRSADSTTSLADSKVGEPQTNDHDQKRRRTDEPTVPSGPRSNRAPPAPIHTLPNRPSETSIKGRASPLEPGQGLRIKSAASAASALSSAQQHNARLHRSSGSEGPGSAGPSPADRDTNRSEPIQRTRSSNGDRPSPDLAARLGGPASFRHNNDRRDLPNESRERSNRRPPATRR